MDTSMGVWAGGVHVGNGNSIDMYVQHVCCHLDRLRSDG